MGFKISWIAFHGTPKERLLADIGGIDTGKLDEASEAPFSGAELPTGWYVLFSNDFEFASAQRLAALSSATDVIGCQVHEGVMASVASAYRQGEALWSLRHYGDQEVTHLETTGSPPAQFAPIRDRLAAAQVEDKDGGVDYYFDIPLETAEALCGYKHDKWKFDWGEPKFTVVRFGEPKPKLWDRR